MVGQEGHEVVLTALIHIGTEDRVQFLHGDGWVEIVDEVGTGTAVLEYLLRNLGIKS